MIISFELKIFIFIKRFILKLSTTCMFLINLIIIDFSFDVFSFIKKIMIHLFMKCRLKSISRKMIIDLYFFMIKKNINRFKNHLSFIFIKHLVSKQSDLKETFLKKIEKFDQIISKTKKHFVRRNKRDH